MKNYNKPGDKNNMDASEESVMKRSMVKNGQKSQDNAGMTYKKDFEKIGKNAPEHWGSSC